jgi:hypothetical protein
VVLFLSGEGTAVGHECLVGGLGGDGVGIALGCLLRGRLEGISLFGESIVVHAGVVLHLINYIPRLH